MWSGALASRMGRSKANERRSPLTEVLARGEGHVATGAAAALPDAESDQLEAVEVAAGKVQLGVGELARGVAVVVGEDLDDEGGGHLGPPMLARRSGGAFTDRKPPDRRASEAVRPGARCTGADRLRLAAPCHVGDRLR